MVIQEVETMNRLWSEHIWYYDPKRNCIYTPHPFRCGIDLEISIQITEDAENTTRFHCCMTFGTYTWEDPNRYLGIHTAVSVLRRTFRSWVAELVAFL
jgi:hypothetical protein